MRPKNKVGITVVAEQAGTKYRVQVNEYPSVTTEAYSKSNVALVARNAAALHTGLPVNRLVVTRVEYR